MHEFATAPAVDKNLPAVQLLQMLAPTAAAKVPEGHAPQIAEASFENWPEGQGVHCVAPFAAAAAPAAQPLQAVAPVLAWNLPASHALQPVEPVAAWKLPALHCTQEVAFSAEKLP
jgi:hypothetical protein